MLVAKLLEIKIQFKKAQNFPKPRKTIPKIENISQKYVQTGI